MAKRVELGSVIVKQDPKTKEMNRYIQLGRKAKEGADTKYNTTVEIIVRDASGKVIGKQTDGFLSLTDPRVEPSNLLAKNIISAELAEKMLAGAQKLPEHIKYKVSMKSS